MHQVRATASVLLLSLLPGLSAAATLLPGGILDSTGRTAYLSSSTGIDAVALAHGDLLWTTADAQQPLLLVGDRLYALAFSDHNVLHVRGFDLGNKGKRVFESGTIELPPWVVTGGKEAQRSRLLDGGAERDNRSFRCTWRQTRTILHLQWQAEAWSEMGPRKRSAGEVRVDLESGKVRVGPAGTPLPAAVPSVPPQLEKRSVRWQRSISGQLHAVVLEDLPDSTIGQRQKRLVLRIWSEKTGQESPPHELLRGSQPRILQGMDGVHLWVRDAAPSPDQASDEALRAYHWSIYSALDGHLVAKVPFLPGTQEAALIGDRVYFLTAAPLRGAETIPTRRLYELHAIDVESGKTLWHRPLSSKALAR